MPIISGGGGGGATPSLAAVLAVGNVAGTSIVADGDSARYLQGPGTSAYDGGGAGTIVMGAQSGGNGGTLSLLGGSATQAAGNAADAYLIGGDGWSTAGARVNCYGGAAAVAGTVSVKTLGSTGASGQALVADGNNALVYGGVRVAAAVPVAAPAGVLPFAYDTTAVTGGFYFWNGAAWVKVATIL